MAFYLLLAIGIIGALSISVYFIYLRFSSDEANKLTIKYIFLGIITCFLYGFIHNVFVNPLYFKSFMNLDFSDKTFQAFLVIWFWRGSVFFLVFAISFNLLLKRAKRLGLKAKFLKTIVIQISLVILAWITNFEYIAFNVNIFSSYELLHWVGGFVAVGMMILMFFVYMEKDVEKYLNITEIHSSIKTRLLLNFVGIIILLVVSQFTILIGCIGIDSNPVLIFKLVFFTVLYLCPLIIIIFKTTDAFSGSLQEAVRFLNSAADSDFSLSIRIDSLDEFGHLAKSLNLLKESFGNLVKTANSSSEKIKVYTGNIDGSIKALNSKIEDFLAVLREKTKKQSSSTSDASGKVELMVKSISDIFINVKKQNDFINEISTSLEEMTNNISNIAVKTRSASEASSHLFEIAQDGKSLIEKTSASMQEIEKASKEIYEINQIINNIAEDTDVLAVNAAIEASHAGDYGKGFAIVAAELRKLAENARNNADIINSLISDIIKKIKITLELSRNSNESFLKINESVNMTNSINTEIAGAMERQSSSIKEITATSVRLTDISCGIDKLSPAIDTNSGEIKNTIQELNKMAESDGKAIAESSQLVWETVKAVSADIENNRKIAENLLDFVSIFKIEV